MPSHQSPVTSHQSPQTEGLHQPDTYPTTLQPRPNLEQRFRAFDKANPHVYTRLRDLALQLKHKGHTHYSMRGLFEILRWEHALATDDLNSPFKLDNGYTSFYARALMVKERALRGFFETRTLRWRRRVPGEDSHP